jgi:hypothetical protein
MKLLNHYLSAVRMYLPMPKRQQDDIINELSENLRSQMEEREAALGRPLTEVEQEGMLIEHGSPMIVAGRYGRNQRTVSFGWQLIGPELFPIYIRILLLNWAVSIVVHPVIAFLSEKPTGMRPFLFSVCSQFVAVTLVFILVDFFQRRTRQQWSFPPAYLQPIPRWRSAAGLAFWIIATAWWVTVLPRVFGSTAADVALAPVWQTIFWPTLLLALVNVGQRSINLVRPDWNWLQPAAGLATNGLGLVLLFVILGSEPYVLVSAAAADPVSAAEKARGINLAIWWSLFSGLSFYLLANAGINAWLCVQHASYVIRRRRAPALARP